MSIRRALPAALAAAACLTMTACGGGQSKAASASASDTQSALQQYEKETGHSTDAPTSTAAATPAQPPSSSIGQPVTNGGVTLTVTSASAVPTIAMNETSYAAGSPYAKYTTEAPPAGSEYFSVSVHVTNNSQVSMDLTCGYPIANKLVNAQQQQYDAIQSLYKLKGNPECNKNLQPGFQGDMTYVYEVPAGSTILGWGFADATDMSVMRDYSTVRFGG